MTTITSTYASKWASSACVSALLMTTALVSVALLPMPAWATDYLVNNEADLRDALASQADGDTITLTNDITLTAGGGGNLPDVHSDVTISGGGHTLSGGGGYRGLFVTSGTVRVEDIAITDALAEGGTSASGGSGAGLGGALFVNEGASVTVSNVDLSGNEAKGGGVSGTSSGGSGNGGAGLLQNGGDATSSNGGAGGGPNGGAGGAQGAGVEINHDSVHGGGTGPLSGTSGSGDAGASGGPGGGGGGGGAAGTVVIKNSNGYSATAISGNGGAGGMGGFGGGGGQGGAGGFAIAQVENQPADSGTASVGGGNGGVGGSGGSGAGGGMGGRGGTLNTIVFLTENGSTGSTTQSSTGQGGDGGQAGFGGSGGKGGGDGGTTLGDGTGAGMGGALFVREGGALIVEGGLTLGGNAVTAGGAGSQAFGSGIFLQGQGNLNFSPDAGQTQTVADVIADQKGVVDNGYEPPQGTYAGTEKWSLTKQGAGRLLLSATNLYAGGTAVGNGTLALSGTGTLGLASNAVSITGGHLDLGGTTQTQNGDILLSGGSIDNGTLSSSGLFDLRAGTVSAELTGTGGLTKTIATTVILTGNSSYTGATSVQDGVLIVDGSIASSSGTDVQNGATLGGTGTVSALMIGSGATLQPGNSIGTLQVAGNLVLKGGSSYAVELNTMRQADKTTVTGTVNIAGGSHLVMTAAAGSYQADSRYTIITATGAITGTFADLTGVTNTAFLTFDDAYDANHVYLDVVQARAFADAAITHNQIATAQGLDSLPSGNALAGAIAGLATDAEARAAFDQLSGELQASAKGMLIEDSHFLRDAASARIDAAFDNAPFSALPVMAYGEDGPEMVAADTDRFAVWGQAFGSWSGAGSDGNAAAFDRSTGGLLAGADTLVGGWRVGLVGGYSHSSFDVGDRDSSGDAESYHLGLYGGTDWGGIAFRSVAAYSSNSISTSRSAAFDGFADTLAADYEAGTAQVFGEFAYKLDAGHLKLEPFANLAYVSVHSDGFTEHGVDAALTSAGTTTDTTFTTLGLRASTDFAIGGIGATARGMLGWRHAFGDLTPVSNVAFAGGATFSIAGAPIDRDAAALEAGIDLVLNDRAKLVLSYAGQFSSGFNDNGFNARLGLSF